MSIAKWISCRRSGNGDRFSARFFCLGKDSRPKLQSNLCSHCAAVLGGEWLQREGEWAAVERYSPCGFLHKKISRVWRQGDTVELNLPKVLQEERLPDNPSRMAFLWGPLVLAGDLGPEVHQDDEENMPAPSAPALVSAKEPVEHWLKAEAGKPGWFKTSGVGLSQDIEFAPFYELTRRKYAVYWDVFTPEEWSKRSAEYKAEQEKQQKLQAATTAFAQPGEMQSERDFNELGEDSAPILWRGRHGRGGKGWFSFDMPVDNSRPVALWVTYGGDRWRESTLDIWWRQEDWRSRRTAPLSAPRKSSSPTSGMSSRRNSLRARAK